MLLKNQIDLCVKISYTQFVYEYASHNKASSLCSSSIRGLLLGFM